MQFGQFFQFGFDPVARFFPVVFKLPYFFFQHANPVGGRAFALYLHGLEARFSEQVLLTMPVFFQKACLPVQRLSVLSNLFQYKIGFVFGLFFKCFQLFALDGTPLGNGHAVFTQCFERNVGCANRLEFFHFLFPVCDLVFLVFACLMSALQILVEFFPGIALLQIV